MAANKTIVITEETKKRLELIKQHRRETYDDIISRLLDQYDKKFKKN